MGRSRRSTAEPAEILRYQATLFGRKPLKLVPARQPDGFPQEPVPEGGGKQDLSQAGGLSLAFLLLVFFVTLEGPSGVEHPAEQPLLAGYDVAIEPAPFELAGQLAGLIAQRAGISKSFLSDLETGKRSLGAETLLDLARAMDLSLDYLMTGKNRGNQTPEVQIPTSLATFAAEEGLSFRQALTLLHMQEQIFANRKSAKKNDLEEVDWRAFYQAVKKFL